MIDQIAWDAVDWSRPVSSPSMRSSMLALEPAVPDLRRSTAEIVANSEDALDWLASLGKLPARDLGRGPAAPGRRDLRARLDLVSGAYRASHRIVSVEATEETERQGLVLALPASAEVTVVGDTGFEPVTSRM